MYISITWYHYSISRNSILIHCIIWFHISGFHLDTFLITLLSSKSLRSFRRYWNTWENLMNSIADFTARFAEKKYFFEITNYFFDYISCEKNSHNFHQIISLWSYEVNISWTVLKRNYLIDIWNETQNPWTSLFFSF